MDFAALQRDVTAEEADSGKAEEPPHRSRAPREGGERRRQRTAIISDGSILETENNGNDGERAEERRRLREAMLNGGSFQA